MSNIKSILKENYKDIIIVAGTVIMLPVISLVKENIIIEIKRPKL